MTDLFAFTVPDLRTVLILNVNPVAPIGGQAFHPDAVYRVNVDTDGDHRSDVAYSFVFSPPEDGRQSVTVLRATGEQARSHEALGQELFIDVPVNFGAETTAAHSAGQALRTVLPGVGPRRLRAVPPPEPGEDCGCRTRLPPSVAQGRPDQAAPGAATGPRGARRGPGGCLRFKDGGTSWSRCHMATAFTASGDFSRTPGRYSAKVTTSPTAARPAAHQYAVE